MAPAPATPGHSVHGSSGPGLGTKINTLDISGQDLAWDSKHNLLYVASPASDPVFPNTIAVVDPTKPTLTQAIPSPSTQAISLSDDGRYLYSGFHGQTIVQRYALPSFSLDLTIPTRAGLPANTVGTHGTCTFAVDVKVAPGNPQSIAVTRCRNPRPGTLLYGSGAGDLTTLAWGSDAIALFGRPTTAVSLRPLSAHSPLACSA